MSNRQFNVAVVIVPMLAGLLMGWFIGASNSPIAATVVPLIFSIATGIGWTFAGQQWKSHKTLDEVLSLSQLKSISKDARLAITHTVLGSGRLGVEQWDAMIWGACMFILMTGVGTFFGIHWRLDQYPPLRQMLKIDKGVDLDNDVEATLHLIRWDMQSRHIPSSEAKEVFSTIVKSIAYEKSVSPRMKIDRLQKIFSLEGKSPIASSPLPSRGVSKASTNEDISPSDVESRMELASGGNRPGSIGTRPGSIGTRPDIPYPVYQDSSLILTKILVELRRMNSVLSKITPNKTTQESEKPDDDKKEEMEDERILD